MKNLSVILLFALAVACGPDQRYTQRSTEIDSVKALFVAYKSGDLESQRSFYAENAEIYYNVPESDPSTFDQILERQKNDLIGISEYSVDFTDDEIEMVTTDNGETWVNVWGEWKATLAATGKEFVIPVHETFQFVDGKIVKEFGYWDNSPVMMAFMELEAVQMAASDTLPAK
ncbi:hypothetical protein GCM10009119_04240 [Algoriphagus jejuensis]|uniref:SnoaL-like domain-containing protein n=1 Tax=Algoriphagus jejuensis TaxID=419934 RepID=A0ABN1MVP0_9BACT